MAVIYKLNKRVQNSVINFRRPSEGRRCYPIAINVAYVWQRHGSNFSPITLMCQSRDSTVSSEPFVSVSCHCRILRSVIIPISVLFYSSLMFYCLTISGFVLINLSSLYLGSVFFATDISNGEIQELKLKCLNFNNL